MHNKRSIVRSHGNRRHQQQRRRFPSAWTSAALMLILASSPTSTTTTRNLGILSFASAFVMPKLRVRSNYQSLAVWSTEDKKRVPIKDEANNDGDDNKILNGKKQPGDEVKKIKEDGLAKPPPGTPLSMIVNETEIEDSFEIHVGRALDTLKKDYPDMLTENPDFSIFDKEVEVIDPTGVKLHGIKAYKNAFRLIHGIVQVFYCPERSGLTFRMCYDTARQSIRVSWNAEVIPKAIFGGVRTTLHVDGISVYEISQKSGMITQHRIERLVMNDTPVRPQQGIFAMLRNEHDESLPVFNVHPISESSLDESSQPPHTGSSSSSSGWSNALQFRRQQRSKLFDKDESSSSTALSTVSAGENEGEESTAEDTMDWEAYERKNASRKKFGVKPLTPEEFMENEAAVRQMESQQRQRAASASAAAEVAKRGGQNRQQGFFDRLFGDIGPEACESNFDCVRPEICCDFGFKKICCASGTFVGNQKLEPALVPVPADMRNRGEEPPSNNNGY